jgi:hypothetical protein
MLRDLLSFPETGRPTGQEGRKASLCEGTDPNSSGELRQKGSNDAQVQKREQELDEAPATGSCSGRDEAPICTTSAPSGPTKHQFEGKVRKAKTRSALRLVVGATFPK